MSRHGADVTTDVRRSVCLGAWVPGQPSQAVECWVENQKSRADFNSLRGDRKLLSRRPCTTHLMLIHMSRGYKANWFAKGGSSTEVSVTRCHLLEYITVEQLLLLPHLLKGRMCSKN